MMAKAKTFTQDQITAAQIALESLPDLRKDKITTPQMLESLKAQIVALSEKKGYSAAEIKSALENVQISVPVSAISALLKPSKKRTRASKPAKPEQLV